MLVPSLCETFLTITHVTGLCTHGLTSSQDCFYTMQEVDIQNWGRALSQFVQVVWCCEAPCAILTFEVILLIVAPTLFWCVTFNASLMPYWFVRNFYCNLALDFATLSGKHYYVLRADQSRDTNQLSHRQMYLAEHWRMHTYRCTYMYD